MTEFDNLKRSYAAAIQCGMAMGSPYQDVRHANDVIHKLCEELIDNSDNRRYSPEDKQAMKWDLEALKETLSREIDAYYRNGQQ